MEEEDGLTPGPQLRQDMRVPGEDGDVVLGRVRAGRVAEEGLWHHFWRHHDPPGAGWSWVCRKEIGDREAHFYSRRFQEENTRLFHKIVVKMSTCLTDHL